MIEFSQLIFSIPRKKYLSRVIGDGDHGEKETTNESKDALEEQIHKRLVCIHVFLTAIGAMHQSISVKGVGGTAWNEITESRATHHPISWKGVVGTE